MIKFILPGLYEHFGLNQSLIQLKQSHPEFFEDWILELSMVIFNSVFGMAEEFL